MIYEFKNAEADFNANLFFLLPSPTWGFYVALIVITLILAYTINTEFRHFRSGGSVPEGPRAIEFGLPSLLYVSIFTYFFHMSGETAVNLEHIYNLYHFGRFSISPHENIDGTVEFIFYLLHYPFAFDVQFLVLGNFLICLLSGWFILWILYGWLRRENLPYRMYFLATYAVAWPITGAATTGFGNIFMAVVIAFVIVRLAENRAVSAAVASSCLPLIRPDGLAWSLLLLIMIGFVYLRQIMRLTPKRMLAVALLVAAPFAASALYWALFEMYYGFASSTPMSLKSVSWERITQFFSTAYFVKSVVDYILDPAIASFLLIGLATFIATLSQTKSTLSETASKVRVPLLLAIAIVLPVLLFIALQATQGRASNWTYHYWVGALLFTVVAYAIGLGLLKESSMRFETAPMLRVLFVLGIAIVPPVVLFSVAHATQGFFGNMAYRYWLGASLFAAMAYAISLGLLKDRFGQSVRFLAYAISAFTVFGALTKEAPSDSIYLNRDWAANAGLMAEQILDGTGLSIGTAEMNTFGLVYVNEHVVDYWGYSNRQIATEGLCGRSRTKYHPTLFLADKTDVFWPYWFTADTTDPDAFEPIDTYVDFEKIYYDDAEYILAGNTHFNQGTPRLGDMRDVMGQYDLVIVRWLNYMTAFLVRRAVIETFNRRLHALGFEHVRSRKTNMDRITDGYLSRPTVALEC